MGRRNVSDVILDPPFLFRPCGRNEFWGVINKDIVLKGYLVVQRVRNAKTVGKSEEFVARLKEAAYALPRTLYVHGIAWSCVAMSGASAWGW